MNEYDLYKYIKVAVITSIIIFIIGLSLLINKQGVYLDQKIQINELLTEIMSGDPLAIIYLGIFNLILIPIVSLFYLDIVYIVKKEKGLSIITIAAILMLIFVILLRLLLF